MRLRRDGQDRRRCQRAARRNPGATARWVTRRPRYACRRCSGAVRAGACARACGARRPSDRGADRPGHCRQVRRSLAVLRQAEIYARQGIQLDRATLGNWAGRARFHLKPIADHMRGLLAAAERLFLDETTAPVLDPGRGKVKKGFFWAIASDDRGHGGQGPPIVLFHYAPGRGGEHAERFLQGFGGQFLQVDAYEGYDRLTRLERPQGPWLLVHCWSHLRRRFPQSHMPASQVKIYRCAASDQPAWAWHGGGRSGRAISAFKFPCFAA
ncbi:IS66 family transposase [Mesorhizobium sp. M0663]|uniref:IS66 family transposase n=1 Tax=unclassified Mesorhizobium TaxID=325217 RepID=UPI00333652D4